MSMEWDLSRYRDTYHERVEELVEAKARGEDIVVQRDRQEPEGVIDLMEALRASVEAQKSRTGAGPAGALESLRKDELYERAAAAGISGRSKMTKSELVEALRKKPAA